MKPWKLTAGQPLVGDPDGWWCVAPNCLNGEDPIARMQQQMSYAAQLGVGYLRTEFPWPLIEPQQGVFDWTRADQIVNEAVKDGVQLDLILDYTPAWAGAQPGYRGTDLPNAQDYHDFVQAIVSRYKSNVHYWEMWLEPNYQELTNATEQQYVQNIEIPGYNAAKAADPSSTVILAGPSSPYTSWLDGLYQAGGGNYFDILAEHDYSGCAIGSTCMSGNAIAYYNDEVSHGQSKPLWVTEYGTGAPNATTGSTVQAQQNLLTGVITSHSASTDIAGAAWYELVDDYPSTCCPVVQGAENKGYGLVLHDDVTLKNSFATLQSLLGSSSPSATSTSVPPSATSTSVPPSATSTSVPPSATSTSVPPSATATRVPATATPTSLAPTATATPTGIPATMNTPTSTVVLPSTTTTPTTVSSGGVAAGTAPVATSSVSPATLATHTAVVATVTGQRPPVTIHSTQSRLKQHAVHRVPLPLTITVTPQRVMSGHMLTIRVHTVRNSHVAVTLEVTAPRWSVIGATRNRHRTRHTIVLYHVLIQGRADASGGFMAHVHITYKPTRLVRARLTANTRLARRTGTRTVWVAILPRRVTTGHT